MSDQIETAMMYVSLLSGAIEVIKHPDKFPQSAKDTFCESLEDIKNGFKESILQIMTRNPGFETTPNQKGGNA